MTTRYRFRPSANQRSRGQGRSQERRIRANGGMQESLQMVEFQRLEAQLRRVVSGEVRFDQGMRAAYSADASNYRQVPIGVVLPRTIEDMVETVRLCASHGAPLLARGGATSLNGQAVNVAVVIDCSKYLDRVLSIDARAGL